MPRQIAAPALRALCTLSNGVCKSQGRERELVFPDILAVRESMTKISMTWDTRKCMFTLLCSRYIISQETILNQKCSLWNKTEEKNLRLKLHTYQLSVGGDTRKTERFSDMSAMAFHCAREGFRTVILQASIARLNIALSKTVVARQDVILI